MSSVGRFVPSFSACAAKSTDDDIEMDESFLPSQQQIPSETRYSVSRDKIMPCLVDNLNFRTDGAVTAKVVKAVALFKVMEFIKAHDNKELQKFANFIEYVQRSVCENQNVLIKDEDKEFENVIRELIAICIHRNTYFGDPNTRTQWFGTTYTETAKYIISAIETKVNGDSLPESLPQHLVIDGNGVNSSEALAAIKKALFDSSGAGVVMSDTELKPVCHALLWALPQNDNNELLTYVIIEGIKELFGENPDINSVVIVIKELFGENPDINRVVIVIKGVFGENPDINRVVIVIKGVFGENPDINRVVIVIKGVFGYNLNIVATIFQNIYFSFNEKDFEGEKTKNIADIFYTIKDKVEKNFRESAANTIVKKIEVVYNEYNLKVVKFFNAKAKESIQKDIRADDLRSFLVNPEPDHLGDIAEETIRKFVFEAAVKCASNQCRLSVVDLVAQLKDAFPSISNKSLVKALEILVEDTIRKFVFEAAVKCASNQCRLSAVDLVAQLKDAFPSISNKSLVKALEPLYTPREIANALTVKALKSLVSMVSKKRSNLESDSVKVAIRTFVNEATKNYTFENQCRLSAVDLVAQLKDAFSSISNKSLVEALNVFYTPKDITEALAVVTIKLRIAEGGYSADHVSIRILILEIKTHRPLTQYQLNAVFLVRQLKDAFPSVSNEILSKALSDLYE